MRISLAAIALLLVAAQDPPNPAEGLTLTLSMHKESYVLGDDLQAHVVLKNNGEPVDVADFVLDERSLAFEITLPGEQTYTWTTLREGPHIVMRLPLQRVRLETGRSVGSIVRIPLIRTGATKIRAVFQGAENPVTSNEVSFDVEESESGNRLIAILEIADQGNLVVDLDPDKAPLSVTHFVALARRGASH